MWFPQPQLLLRFATAGDGDLVAALCAQLSKDEGSPRTSRFSAQVFRRDGFGPKPKFRCIGAEISGKPVGYVLHCPDYVPTISAAASTWLIFMSKRRREGGESGAL